MNKIKTDSLPDTFTACGIDITDPPKISNTLIYLLEILVLN